VKTNGAAGNDLLVGQDGAVGWQAMTDGEAWLLPE